MNDTMITIAGNVVDQPRLRRTKNGHMVVNFRVASTSRRYDREQERFVDNTSLFINVTAWRAMAENIGQSLHKGQPVIVHGRYYTRDYTVNEQPRTSYELEATALGHDLARGVTTFERVYRPAAPEIVTDENGVPTDDSDHWHDLAEDEVLTDGRGSFDSAAEPDGRELAAV